jgi:hypothetical protein
VSYDVLLRSALRSAYGDPSLFVGLPDDDDFPGEFPEVSGPVIPVCGRWVRPVRPADDDSDSDE